MPPHRDTELLDIVRRVSLYLDANSSACDTAEGITRWWLKLNTGDPALLERTLQWMKDHRLLEQLATDDGRVHYRRSGTKSQFASALATIDPPRG